MEQNKMQNDKILWTEDYRVYRCFRDIIFIKIKSESIRNKAEQWRLIAIINLEENKYKIEVMEDYSKKEVIEHIRKIQKQISKKERKRIFREKVLQEMEAEMVLKKIMGCK